MIERVDVLAIGPAVERYSWAADLDAQAATLTLVRVYDECGVVGLGASPAYSTGRYDLSLFETLRLLAPRVLGADAMARERVWYELQDLALPVLPGALSTLDIALWDIAAQRSGLPLYQMLGGRRSSLPAYASLPLMSDTEAYLECVARLLDEGFRAFKFHAWCEPDRDLAMLRRVRERFPDEDLQFMHDAEQRYDRRQAVRVATELYAMGFGWLEAPLPDADIEGYAELRRRTNLPIIPGGNTLVDMRQIYSALRLEPWDAVRFDVTVVGGVTPARKLVALAEAAGVWAELQSWGYSLIQVPNLHLGLAVAGTGYFELPIPYNAYEFGVLNPIRLGSDGRVTANTAPGLGLDLDWERLESSVLGAFTCSVGSPEPQTIRT